MTQTRSLRPDARLVQLHAERGDPASRLAGALAALEEADWGLLLSGEVALARQLVALLGPGTLRVDGRLRVSRGAMAEAGLAVADLHGDLKGARAVWLMEPDEAVLGRARRAGVSVIVDGTLAPGGGWPQRGADYVVYSDGVTLTGHADAPLAALFGKGRAPEAAAPAPSDLSVALALRDVATLPLRLARAARTVGNVGERLGGAARGAGPTALLLPPDAAADTVQPPGGVLAAVRHVPDGVLLTPGLEDTERVLALLREAPTEMEQPTRDVEEASTETRTAPRDRLRRSPDETRQEGAQFTRRDREDRRERRFERRPDRQGRFDRPRPDRAQADVAPGAARADQSRFEASRLESSPPDRQERTRNGAGRDDRLSQRSESAVPERFTFEASPPSADMAASGIEAAQPEETWEPEIVFSDLDHAAPPLTHTVSSGPDAPEEGDLLPDLLHDLGESEAVPEDGKVSGESKASENSADLPGSASAGDADPSAVDPASTELVPAPAEPASSIVPDLPATRGGKEDPAANLTDEQAAIYARLREWRNAEAKRQEISRFIIASNASLAEIARRVPYTLEDLAAVKGMGKARLEKYGQQILNVVKG